MLLIPQILVRAFALGASTVAMLACGQQGPLYLPQTGTIQRATLPESLLPDTGKTQTTVQPADTASSPQR